MAEYFYTSLKTVMYTGLEWCRFFVQLFSSSSLSGKGIEAMNIIRKGQVLDNKSVLFEVEFINQLFGIAN